MKTHPMDMETQLQRTQPRPRCAFEQELEEKLIQQFKQIEIEGDPTMAQTLVPALHRHTRTASAAWRWTALAAAILMIVLGMVVVSLNPNRTPQATALAIGLATFTPQPDRVQVEIPYPRFDLWGLPNFTTLPAYTPVQLWIASTTATTYTPIDILQLTSSATFIETRRGNPSRLVFEMEISEAQQIQGRVMEDSSIVRLIALPDHWRPLPTYALTEERGWWRQAPSYETVVIPLERIDFTSNDLFLGDRVTLHIQRGENTDSLETLATDVLVLDIDVLPDAQQTEYVALQVQSSEAANIEQLLLESLQFELLKEPTTPRMALTTAYPKNVIDSAMASALMESCGMVNIIGVALSADTLENGPTSTPTVNLEPLARDVRVLLAPVNDWASWVFQFSTSDEAVRVWEYARAGGLYLDLACP